MPAHGERPPFCYEEAERIARSASPGAGKRYGLQRVCRIFGLPRSTAYYLKAPGPSRRKKRPVPRKRGPVGAGTDDDLVGHIRRVLAESPFHGEGYRKVWARLRHRGIRTASERVRRLMREHHLQAPRKGGHAHGPRAHDGTITTEEPDTMWGTDMTTTVTADQGTVHVFIAVDHCTCECIGLHAAKKGDRFEALEPLRQGVRERFGTFGAEAARGLTIRHDRRRFRGRRLPAGTGVPGGHQLAEFRAGAGGQWLRRAVHPHAEGAAPVGADLRHGRGAGRGLRGRSGRTTSRWLIGRGHRTPSRGPALTSPMAIKRL